MAQDHESEDQEAEEMRRALGMIGVAAVFAVITGLIVVGVGSWALEAASRSHVILVASR